MLVSVRRNRGIYRSADGWRFSESQAAVHRVASFRSRAPGIPSGGGAWAVYAAARMKVRQPPSRVFISSTVRDLAAYRVQLKCALEEYANGLHCNLSEDWANSFAAVTRRVQQVLES